MMTTYDDRPWLKAYDPGTPPDIAIPAKTYTDALLEGLAAAPDRAAMHFMGTALSYRQLDEMSCRFAAFLTDNHVKPGDVVGLSLPNIPQFLIALCGALRVGCTVTGVSPLLTPKELSHQLNDSGCRVLVTLDAVFERVLTKIENQVPGLSHVVTTRIGDYLPAIKRILGRLLKKLPTGKVTPLDGKMIREFTQVMAQYPPNKPKGTATPESICLIQYTGGTTGLPKGVALTHRNIFSNLTQVKNWTEFQMARDVLCSGFPFFHLAGLMFGMTAMATASTQCLIPDPRNTRHICKEIRTHAPSIYANVPTLYQMLMDDPGFKKLDFTPARIFVSGAAPFAVESIRAFEAIVGRGKVVEVYGMTETSPIITGNPLAGNKKIGSVGVPVSNTHVRIVDVETGTKIMPVGDPGELIVRGPQVMKGYHNKPEETDHALREHDGRIWLHTGDVARMDEDGYFYIVDRAKDMLNVGGFKVFSREVEETLYRHPSVEFCAIIGRPDPKRPGSEIVKVVIQPASGAKGRNTDTLKEDIISYCRENMAPYKVPKIVEFVDEMPLTTVGKVDKKALR
ncbi:MAG: AMP-dependent synthetase [Desulfobacterales bacterium CG23_combo_of_CG06-09_8_20_14_all_51_8]|nr:MAG: AMP-dependent synthetase [Desulfobacterales bacterium CG23_combo_of_CG06-09_8_20_14_all_51_8]